ncbi:hypothetical protein LP420_37200 [Massilia sp. B-10]|nr:hypothetical protein LP420_37200 [Massilia sp. B-10]
MLGQAILAMTDLRGVSDAALVSLLPWLGEAEQERWRRFQRSERRRQFIVGPGAGAHAAGRAVRRGARRAAAARTRGAGA